MRNSTTKPSSEDTSQTTRLNRRITSVKVGGFKAITQVKDIEIGSLTILAGANSSGKSSALQPLLILKQTIHDYRGGSDLVLSGGHTNFTDKEQILSKTSKDALSVSRVLTIGLTLDKGDSVYQTYEAVGGKPLAVTAAHYRLPGWALREVRLTPGMNSSEIKAVIQEYIGVLEHVFNVNNFRVKLDDGFLGVILDLTPKNPEEDVLKEPTLSVHYVPFTVPFWFSVMSLIHVRGVRGLQRQSEFIPPRGLFFPGSMELYAAALLLEWQREQDTRLDLLRQQLSQLALTSSISAKSINDTTAEISVARSMAHPDDLVSIADVGFGVSQVLPVLLALLAAGPEQLVYIEQPEVHLHPNAQVALAQIICEAVRNGVQVVMETHSELMLLAVQTAVAKQELDPSQVVLHWFSQSRETGETDINSRKLNADGSFGDWPVDFSSVTMDAQLAFIRSVHALKDSSR